MFKIAPTVEASSRGAKWYEGVASVSLRLSTLLYLSSTLHGISSFVASGSFYGFQFKKKSREKNY